jgi:polyisoprenoid-binding protein YceI
VRHPLRWLFAGIGLVIAALIAVGAWYVFGGSAPAKPSLSSDPVATGGPATPDGTWKVVQGKDVYLGYRMTEVFGGDIVHKTAVGRTPNVSGTMTITGDRVTAARVSGDLRELHSDRAPRDNYIHTHAIESDQFPEATFELTEPISLRAPLSKGTPVHVSATGDLTLHGVTRRVTVPLDARWTGPTVEVVGTAPIVLRDYKIEPPQTSVVRADDHGSLELALTFQPS